MTLRRIGIGLLLTILVSYPAPAEAENPNGVLRVRVRNPDGVPISGVQVMAEPSPRTARPLKLVTGSNGIASRKVPKGSYRLSLSKPGYGYVERTAHVGTYWIDFREDPSPVELVLEPGIELNIEFLDDENQPIPGEQPIVQTARVVDHRHRMVGATWNLVRTSPTSFRTFVPPGTYYLRATAPRMTSPSAHLEVTAPGPHKVRLVPRHLHRALEVEVLCQGHPCRNAELHVGYSLGNGVNTGFQKSIRDGTPVILEVPRGEIELVGRQDEGTRDELKAIQTVKVEADDLTRLRLDLLPPREDATIDLEYSTTRLPPEETALFLKCGNYVRALGKGSASPLKVEHLPAGPCELQVFPHTDSVQRKGGAFPFATYPLSAPGRHRIAYPPPAVVGADDVEAGASFDIGKSVDAGHNRVPIADPPSMPR